jgi:FdhD protein
MTHGWAPESAVWLEINGRRRILATCTPDDLEAQTAGYLLTEGYIVRASEIARLQIVNEPADCAGVRASVPETGVVRVGQLRRHIREHGCGLHHFTSCDRVSLAQPRALAIPEMARFRDLFRQMFADGDRRYPGGGMHGAALTDGERVTLIVHDVGRHNAIDKLVGRALLNGIDLTKHGILLTARVSGMIALKAAMSRVSWVASRSIPTTLAAGIAAAAGLPLIARAPSQEAVVV